MRAVVVNLIKFYQYLLSPWIGNHCRFHPTCSEYAKGAIERYGVARGALLAGKRLLSCHPWHPGGADPVP